MNLTTNLKVKLIFVIWLVAFPLISCGPALASHSIVGFLFGGFVGILLGSVLFVPWLVGIAVLYLVMRLTEEPRAPGPPR
jgi:hypothetical protein